MALCVEQNAKTSSVPNDGGRSDSGGGVNGQALDQLEEYIRMGSWGWKGSDGDGDNDDVSGLTPEAPLNFPLVRSVAHFHDTQRELSRRDAHDRGAQEHPQISRRLDGRARTDSGQARRQEIPLSGLQDCCSTGGNGEP